MNSLNTPSIQRVELNGMKVFPFSSARQLLQYVDDHKGILVAVNAEKVSKATEATRAIVNDNIGYADGAGVVMAMHRKGYSEAVRIAGCDLWLDIIRECLREKSFYLIGGKQEVIDETVKKLKREYPDIRILGHRNGYITTEEEREMLINDITEKQPDVVFVAMGSPKQELLMHELAHKHRAIYQGLGGSFDVYTGRVKRAPQWWQKHNLEFLYRLIRQPSRISRQIYLVGFYLRVRTGLI